MERQAAVALVDRRPERVQCLAGPQVPGQRRPLPGYASNDRIDPYNAARVAAWHIRTSPRSWKRTWLCKGVYDRKVGRLR